MHDSLLRLSVNRRNLLFGAAALTGAALVDNVPCAAGSERISRDPFTLGVASGDPNPDGFVLWTRLAPEPLNGGGMPDRNFPVLWEVALDESMKQVVRRGETMARPGLAHSVHVTLYGLEPGRPYWYRFRIHKWISRTGRTRTAPALASHPERLAFAFASCQDWQNGLYAAYHAMAQEELDFVVHLGDYIYEGGDKEGGPRRHNTPEPKTLVEYRNRHALYKTDPSLQASHARFPFIVTPDDHEVENDYAGAISENNDPAENFLARRAAAYQAYYEHMPLRLASLPEGPAMQLYRRFRFGDLAEMNVLDTRQFRSDQPRKQASDPLPGALMDPRFSEAEAPAQTMTGRLQEAWLLSGLDRSRAHWNFLAQQTMFAQFDFQAGAGSPPSTPGQIFNLDQWDGYIAQRRRLLNYLLIRKPSNPVIITGDIHSSWVNDVKADFSNPTSPTVATEFVGTSISSSFPQVYIQSSKAALSDNPHTRFFDGEHRGYVRCQLTAKEWRSDYRIVPTTGPTGAVVVADAPATTLASFVVEDGQPGAKRV